jgi:putative transposase
MHYRGKKFQQDRQLLSEIRSVVEQHPRYGYRRVWALLNRARHGVNPKRVYRLWKEQGLSLRRRKGRRRRGPHLERAPVAQRVNEVWAYDFVHDRCATGEKLKGLVVVDEYTREALTIEIDQRIRANRVIEILKRLIAQRGTPQYLRSDNGPEFVAKAVQAWLVQSQIGPVHIDPGKPWQNGVAESFIGKLRDE